MLPVVTSPSSFCVIFSCLLLSEFTFRPEVEFTKSSSCLAASLVYPDVFPFCLFLFWTFLVRFFYFPCVFFKIYFNFSTQLCFIPFGSILELYLKTHTKKKKGQIIFGFSFFSMWISTSECLQIFSLDVISGRHPFEFLEIPGMCHCFVSIYLKRNHGFY